MGKRVYIIAGEASGDLHGGNLTKALFAAAHADGKELLVRAWGGDRMAAAGAEVVKHYRDLAFMGFTQVIMNLRTILRNIAVCKEDIVRFKPDALVLIDYPGFNLRIAEWAHEQGIADCEEQDRTQVYRDEVVASRSGQADAAVKGPRGAIYG